MPRLSATSLHRLSTCDHRLQYVIRIASDIVPITVIEGHRPKALQDKAVAEGKSQKPWPTGNHNAMPSRAVDIAPIYYELKIVRLDWKDLIAFGRVMGVVQAIAARDNIRLRFGLDWDGDFRSVNRDPDESFLDAPHVELVDL